MSQAGRLGTVAALLLVGLIISGCLLLLPTDRLRLGGRLNSAATGTALHSVSLCPRLECPNCTALRIAADERTRQQKKTKLQQGEQQQHEEEEQEETEEEQEQQQKQQQQQQQQAAVAGNASAGGEVPLLCGGLPSVPSVQDALAEAWARLEASLDAAFATFAGGFTLEDLMHTATALGVDGTHDTQVWVEIRNQTVVFPRRHKQECKWFCNEWLRPRIEGIERGMRDGWLRIPDGLPMLWNVYDYSVCKPGKCTAPLLSSIRWAEDADVLVPPFGPRYEPHWVPWEQKSHTAFFRGTNFCREHPLNGTAGGGGANCSRAVLSELSRQWPDLLNCSLLGNGVQRVPHAEFANFKYLLALDGYTASSRLGSLLPINSAVLKQQSQWLEWYYAALQPCVHYLPFWQQSEDDVLGLLRALRGAPANQALAQALAANSYTFAAAVLGDAGVYRYWQRVIDRYVELYRGPVDAQATLAAKAWAERVGQRASAHGAVVEAKCWADGGQNCWYVGRDAAKAIVVEEGEKAAAGAKGGGGGGGDSGTARNTSSASRSGGGGGGGSAEGSKSGAGSGSTRGSRNGNQRPAASAAEG